MTLTCQVAEAILKAIECTEGMKIPVLKGVSIFQDLKQKDPWVALQAKAILITWVGWTVQGNYKWALKHKNHNLVIR